MDNYTRLWEKYVDIRDVYNISKQVKYAACLPISTRNNIDTSYLLSKRLERHSSRVYIRLEITYHKRPALFHFSEIKIKSWFAIFYQIWFSKQQCQYTVCMLSIYRQIGNWSTPKRPDCAMISRAIALLAYFMQHWSWICS